MSLCFIDNPFGEIESAVFYSNGCWDKYIRTEIFYTKPSFNKMAWIKWETQNMQEPNLGIAKIC